MLHVSTQKLIHKLWALTQASAIAWSEDEGDALVFDTEGYRVELRGEPPSLRLLGNDGKELESATASDLASTRWPEGEGTFATHVSEMARQALRIARGADLAISQILSSLSAPPQKVGEPVPAFEGVPLKEAEPPPSPHTVPEPPVQPPPAETAVGKLFAVGAAPTPAADTIESAPVEPEAETTVEAAEEELPLEESPEPARTEIEQAEPARPPLPEPQHKVPVFAEPGPPRPYAPVQGGFGGIRSFAVGRPISPAPEPRATPAPQPVVAVAAPPARAEPPAEPKVTSTGLFISSISATTRQTVRGELPPEHAAPAPSVQTPPAPEPKREPAVATGPDIYKPWV